MICRLYDDSPKKDEPEEEPEQVETLPYGYYDRLSDPIFDPPWMWNR